MKTTIVLLLLTLISASCSKGTVSGGAQFPAAQSATQPSQVATTGTLTFKVPQGWVEEKPTSSMRAAQYKLPKVDGDSEDGSLVLYYFGQGQGGATQANIDRWIGQIHQTDGSDSKARAKLETLTINGLKVTTVDASGTYSAEMSPGSGDFSSKPNYRLRGAVVETPKGSYFAKLTGPEKTINHWDQAFHDYLYSFEFK